jgi:hypothetical protein
MQSLDWIRGGRPMTFVRYAFRDHISGERVNLYIDKFHRHWFATSPNALFRSRCREMKFVSYSIANAMLKDDVGWRIAPEEDYNRTIGYVHLERLL